MFFIVTPAEGIKINLKKKHNHTHSYMTRTTKGDHMNLIFFSVMVKVNEDVLRTKTAVLILSSHKRRKYFMLVSVSKAGRCLEI